MSDAGVAHVLRTALQRRPGRAAVLAAIDAVAITRGIDRRRPAAGGGGMRVESDAGHSRTSALRRRLADGRLRDLGPMAAAIVREEQSFFGGPDEDAIGRGRVYGHLLTVGAKRIVGVHRRARKLRAQPAVSGVVASIDEAVERHVEALGIAGRHADFIDAGIVVQDFIARRHGLRGHELPPLPDAMDPTRRRRKCPRGPASPCRREKCRGRSSIRPRRPAAAATPKRRSVFGTGRAPRGLAPPAASRGCIMQFANAYETSLTACRNVEKPIKEARRIYSFIVYIFRPHP